jgi:hypothetical protein
MSIPSAVGLPQEMKLGEVDYSLPPDARSYQVNVQPSNVSSVVQTGISLVNAAAGPPTTIPQFASQTLFFDLPCGASPSTFIDNRFTTISFRANITVTTAIAGAGATLTAFQRSGGYSWFDRMYITAQNGNIVEDVTEYGLVNDLMVATQLNTATRDTLATQYGFLSGTNNEAQGHAWTSLAIGTGTTGNETFSYSMPLTSSLIGVTADRFFNIGRTNKLQVAFQTPTELPISIASTGAAVTGGIITVTLSDFALQCNYIDVGPAALAMLDATLPDRKGYIHGQTYKTSSISMPAVAGSQSLLAGIRGSSVKSLFVRFQDGGAVSTTNSSNGKYDSKNPLINSINFNVGGQKLPNNPVNPLLNPSRAFRALQMAAGSYNNSQFQSSMIPSSYCKLAAGGTAQAVTVGATQAYFWNLGSVNNALCQFIYGEDIEVVARRGLMSGLNCNSAPVFVELNVASAPTNSQIVYVHALSDCVYIHDLATGDVQVRL